MSSEPSFTVRRLVFVRGVDLNHEAFRGQTTLCVTYEVLTGVTYLLTYSMQQSPS